MTRIQPVVLCGGSGSRMWPLSRQARPKQLLHLTGDRSLVQDTLDRLDGLDAAPPLVVCSTDVRFSVQEQLRERADVTLLVEPEGRNTAPAVGITAMLTEDDPLLLVLPSDHHIQDVPAFQQAVRAGVPLAESGALVVFGVQPHKAETGYGYIQRGAPRGQGFEVARFVEKPDEATAQRYVDAGDHWWNAGMFLFRASRYMEELTRFAPRMAHAVRHASEDVHEAHGFTTLGPRFAACPADSIDYAVMERTEEAVVVPLDAGWSDLGSWTSLWEVSERDAHGNAVRGDALLVDATDCLVHAGHRLVVGIGLKDHVVVETADAVLVAPKAHAQDVREAVRTLTEAGRQEVDVHTVVSRPWGSYEVLTTAPGYVVKRLHVRPGSQLSLQFHARRSERWVVVQGVADAWVDGTHHRLTSGDGITIDVGQPHRLANLGAEDAVLIEVQLGDISEDDIVRLVDDYGRSEGSGTPSA